MWNHCQCAWYTGCPFSSGELNDDDIEVVSNQWNHSFSPFSFSYGGTAEDGHSHDDGILRVIAFRKGVSCIQGFSACTAWRKVRTIVTCIKGFQFFWWRGWIAKSQIYYLGVHQLWMEAELLLGDSSITHGGWGASIMDGCQLVALWFLKHRWMMMLLNYGWKANLLLGSPSNMKRPLPADW